MEGHVDIAQALVEGGAEMDDMFSQGRPITALMKGRLSMVTYLIGAGASLDKAIPPLGNNPLLLAGDVGTVEIVRALVEGGANINATTIKGDTALSKAAWGGTQRHLEMVRYLASVGADLEQAREDSTPLIVAAGRDLEEVARFDFLHFQAIQDL